MDANQTVGQLGGGQEQSPPLPTLREDLEMFSGWPSFSGEASWVIFDPLRNRYFKIGNSNFQMLSQWGARSIEAVQKTSSELLGKDVSVEDVGALAKFLLVNQLTNEPAEQGYRSYLEQENRSQKSFASSALHGYLFFKIPLCRPDKFLQGAWPFVAPFFTKTSVLIFSLMALAALYLVSRQWDVFSGQFIDFLSWKGLVYYGFSLVIVKIFHELGHGFMAIRYGLRVPVMGIAFLVLMPVLYTDTSNAWRLADRRQRLMIDGAGIMTELVLAVIATLLWVFLADGPLRDVAFSVATVGWLISLAVNLNPFMRFDGYYILSDMLGFENMQGRGFTLARWKLRETLFGLGEERPELLPRALERVVVSHAFGTWIYRFFLFLGIALLVYSFFIKTVAIFLFVVEIIWFIALPIYREMKEWWLMRDEIIHTKRSRLSALIFLMLFAAAFLPLSAKVSVPALMRAGADLAIYPPSAAKLVELHARNGASVLAGQTLLRFESDSLNRDITLSSQKIALLQRRIARGNADAEDGAARQILMTELATEEGRLIGLRKQQSDIRVKAPVSGVVTDLEPWVHIGRTLSGDKPLFRIVGQDSVKFHGLVSEEDVARLSTQSQGKFVPDNPLLSSMVVQVTSIASTQSVTLPDPELAEMFGGGIPARRDQSAKVISDGAFYAVRMAPKEHIEAPKQTIRGVVLLDGESRSFAGAVFKRVAGVLIRESGF